MPVGQARRDLTPSARNVTRSAFTLLEIAVAVGILAVIAAVFLYSQPVESQGDRDRYASVAEDLYDLAQAIAGNEPIRGQSSFRWVIGVYPGSLSHLTTPITTGQANICGAAYTGTQTPKWLNPFWSRVLLTGGTNLAQGFTLQNALVRLTAVPTPGLNQAGIMTLRFPSVTQADAQGLDAIVDETISGAAGTVRYAGTDPTALDYYILISGC